jgi:polar amino acid transport system permease protein
VGYDWDFSSLLPYRDAIARAFLVTVGLTIASISLGTVLGIPLGVLLRTRVRPARGLLLAFVDVIRSLPVLVLLLGANYFLPPLIGVNDLSPFVIAWLALSLNLCVFIADVVRGAIENVPAGELDAARAVGLTEWQVFRRFTFRRIVRLTLPTFVMLSIATAKNSSLASAIAVVELTHMVNLIVSDRMRTLEVYTLVAVLYVALILPLSMLARRVEQQHTRAARRLNEAVMNA